MGYRCYILDAEDHIVQAHDLECETDERAVAMAEDLLARDPYHGSVEVWIATRRVVKLERGAPLRRSASDIALRSVRATVERPAARTDCPCLPGDP